MFNDKFYFTTNHSTFELVNHIYRHLLKTQKMETQLVNNNLGDAILLQARVKGGKFKKFVGLDKAITLRFTEAPGAVNVEIGEAKWIDKSIVMTISMFVLWPLAITSGFGIYKQKKLISDLLAEMDNFMTEPNINVI